MARIEPKVLRIELLAPCRRRRTPLPHVESGTVDLIRRHGVFQPVVVRPLDGGYEILANLVTWLAAQRVGIDRLPVTILDGLDDRAADEILAADQDGPMVRAERYWRALEAMGGAGRRGAIGRVADQFGVDRTSVAHALRLRSLPGLLKEALVVGALRAGHAKALLGCADEPRQLELATRTITERWSVRRLERELAGAVVTDRKPPARRPPDLPRLERSLSALLGSPVRVREAEGLLEIDYRRDLDVLAGLLERFGHVG